MIWSPSFAPGCRTEAHGCVPGKFVARNRCSQFQVLLDDVHATRDDPF